MGTPKHTLTTAVAAVLTTAAVAAVSVLPTEAAACSIPMLTLELDPTEQAEDMTAPQVPVFEVEQIKRGTGAVSGGCGSVMTTSCDDLGWIALRILETGDDRTPTDAIGYLVEVEGQVPAGFTVPQEPIQVVSGTTISLPWIDGATDGQEPIAFSITLRAVDLGGNMSEPSAPVEISEPGGSESGCMTATGRRLPAGGIALALGALLLSRKRPRARG